MCEAVTSIDEMSVLTSRPAESEQRGAAPSDMAQASDPALAESAAAGDMESFEELYRRHAGRVYSVCLRMTGSRVEAEDLTHDVFVHLFRRLGSFRGASAFSTWLHRVAVNTALMHFRKRRARPEVLTEEGEMPGEGKPRAGDPDRTPVIDRITLEEALAQLPPGYRTVFILHDVEGYEHEEIARMLGVAPGTSKSQLHKARMRLRVLIGKRAAPDDDA